MNLAISIKELQLLLPSDIIRIAVGNIQTDLYEESNALPVESRLNKYIIKKPANLKSQIYPKPAKPLCDELLTTDFIKETANLINEYKRLDLFGSLYDSEFVGQIIEEIGIKRGNM